MKTITGVVTSAKNEKTVTVEVTKLWRHPVYNKRVKKTKKFMAHNEKGAQLGDTVVMTETRPLSKFKHFEVTKIITQ